MLNPILPRQADNAYRGQKAALWILGLVILLRLMMGANSAFNAHTIATTADGIPIDAYPAAAAQTILSMFAALGLNYLLWCAFGIIVLIRYRTLVPLTFLLLLTGLLARQAERYFLPIPTVGAPAATVINPILIALMVVGLALSLWPRRNAVIAP
jgi:hypothetical protein